jgi:hypothetical protein
MDPYQQLSNVIFRLGQVAPKSCSHCFSQNSLCIVSVFSNSCGLCLRSSRCCSFLLASVPPWMNSIIPSPTQELRSDLHRTIGVLSQIAVSFDALSEPSGSSTVQILGSCQDSKGLLPLPRNLHQGTLPIESNIRSCFHC